MPETQSSRQNHPLRALPVNEWDRVIPHLELVHLTLGEVLYESGNELQHVHFPATGAIVSLLYVMADGASAEIAVVGDELAGSLAVHTSSATRTRCHRGSVSSPHDVPLCHVYRSKACPAKGGFLASRHAGGERPSPKGEGFGLRLKPLIVDLPVD